MLVTISYLSGQIASAGDVKKTKRRVKLCCVFSVGSAQVGGVLPGGILLRGVSGGERKRLNIGTSIIARPSIVFLDEPTSGAFVLKSDTFAFWSSAMCFDSSVLDGTSGQMLSLQVMQADSECAPHQIQPISGNLFRLPLHGANFR